MLVTLALLVVCASIAVFFSQEFVRTFKKIMAIKGAKLVLPLILGSVIVYNFIFSIMWLVVYVREALNKVISWIAMLIPAQQWATPIAMIVVLTLLSVLPVYWLDYLSRKKAYHPYRHPYVASTLFWVVLVMLLLGGRV